MRLHRFIQQGIHLGGDSCTITEAGLVHQIQHVLRLTTGSRFILADGKDTEAEIEITGMTKKEIVGNIISLTKKEPKEQQFHLYIATPKKTILETVVQMCTEIGVASITPLICERTVKTGVVLPRLEKIAQEASELSGRCGIPSIVAPCSLATAVEDAVTKNMNIILFDRSGTPFQKKNGPVAIFIGPEGGFTEQELSLIKHNGGSIVTLGENTLRIETAAIVASSLFI